MKVHIVIFGVIVGLSACAPVPEPETPPPVAPTKRSPRREPLLPAPSRMPDIVYASAMPFPTANTQRSAMR